MIKLNKKKYSTIFKKKNIILYLNSKKKIKGLKNSVYEINIYLNYLLILDYRNNFVIYYNLVTNTIDYKVKVNSPHGVFVNNDLIYVVTYKKSELIIIKNFKIYNIIRINKLFPISFLKLSNKNLICNWNSECDKKIIMMNKDFTKELYFFEKENKYDKPHGLIQVNNKIYSVSHNSVDPKILIFNLDGKLSKVIRNKHIKDPVSIKFFNKNFFICDYYNNSIIILDVNFKIINVIKNFFYYPMNIFFTKNQFIVCEEKSNRILSFKSNL